MTNKTITINGTTFKYHHTIIEINNELHKSLYVHDISDKFGDFDFILICNEYPETEAETIAAFENAPIETDFYYNGIYHSNRF